MGVSPSQTTKLSFGTSTELGPLWLRKVIRVLAAAGICNGGHVYDRLAGQARGKVDALLAGGFADAKLATCLMTLARAHKVACKLRGASLHAKPAAASRGCEHRLEQRESPAVDTPQRNPATSARMGGASVLPRLRLSSELLPAPPSPEDTFRWQLVSYAAGVEGWSGCIAWNAPEHAQCAAPPVAEDGRTCQWILDSSLSVKS